MWIEIFSYNFMIYAFIIGILVALVTALISPFIVLNNQSMLADGLAHTSFLGFVIGVILTDQPIYIALIIAAFASFLIKLISTKASINNDAAIGVVSSLSFAIGLIIISVTKGFNVSIESLMTGSLLTTNIGDIIITSVLAVVTISFVLYYYRNLYQNVFDKENIVISRKKSIILDYALSMISALIIVVGVKIVGALLVSSLIIFPTLIATQFKRSFKATLVISVITSILTMFISIYISYLLDIPASSTVVVINALVLLGAYLYKFIGRSLIK
ncbi:MAG TPA: metal ABC transporter permease [Bacilli bacterium]|nr:metal ABC transporter permease [Bacilli bacterium]